MITTYNLPYDYELDYLYLHGGVYFDTGMTATNDSYVKLVVKFAEQWDDTSIKKGLFGLETETKKIFDIQCRAYYLAGLGNSWTGGSTYSGVKPNIVDGDVIEFYKGVLKINGVVVDTRPNTVNFTTTGTMWAFNVADGVMNRGFIGRIKALEFYRNGKEGGAIPDIDWYPVMKDGKLGMYNRMNGITTFPTDYASDANLLLINPGNVVHTHDENFVAYTDFGGMLGRLPGSTKLLTGDDYNNIFFSVDYVPSATTSPYGAIILTKNYGEYIAGQMLKKVTTTGGTYTWTPINGPVVGTDAPYDVRAHRVGGRYMKIRWRDPDDKWNGSTLTQWKYTRVIRKLGSYPTGIHDGVVVCDNAVRDYYNERILTDVLPLGINGVWYYRLFAVSTDGVAVTGEKASFFPIDLEWSTLSSYIQSGYGPSILGIGDVVQLEGAPYSDANKIYNNLELVVVGFDLFEPTLAKIRHTITFASRYALLDSKFDKAWSEKYLVEDEIVVSGLKTYYKRSGGSGTEEDPYTYTVAKPQPRDGYHITAKDGYYLSTPDNRSKYGCNIWNKCTLHKWAIACADHTYKLTTDTSVVTSKTYYKASANTDNCYYDAYTFATGSENPSALGLYEEDAAITFDANSYIPPLKAIRAIDKEFSELIRSVKVKTGLGLSEREEETYVEADELCTIPSYSEALGLINYDVYEGETFPYFTSTIDHRKISRNSTTATKIDWWTRSPVIPDYMDLTEDETFQNGTNYYTRSGVGTEKEPYIYTLGYPGVDYQIGEEIPENTWFVSIKEAMFTVRGIGSDGGIKDFEVSNTETTPTTFASKGVVFVVSIG